MKKLLALLLSVITIFSLAACSDQEDDDDDDRKTSKKKPTVQQNIQITPLEAPDAEPTDEEISLLYNYYDLCSEIANMTDSGYEQDYLQSIHQRLLDMEDVDRWLQTDFAKNLLENDFHADMEVDRQTLLRKFARLDDVLLSYERTVYTDNLGNLIQDEGERTFWHYDTDGTLNRIDNEDFHRGVFAHNPEIFEFRIEYNAEGQPVCKRYYSYDDQIVYMVIYNYDENNRIVSEEQRHNTSSRFVYYAYDEDGRLSQLLWDDYERHTLDYVYDESGNLVKETYSTLRLNYYQTEYYLVEQSVREYTYDNNGQRVGGSFTELNYSALNGDEVLSGTLTFLYDSDGRILQEVREYGPLVIRPGQENEVTKIHDISSETYEYTYGTYYAFSN